MQFDIDKFFDRIQEQALSKQLASEEVDREIKNAGDQKVVFLDQASENPEYYKFICNQIDDYIVCLKVLRSRIAPQDSPDMEEHSFNTDKVVFYHTMRLLFLLQQHETKAAKRKARNSAKKTKTRDSQSRMQQ